MHHHPDVHQPWSAWSETEKLHVAVAYNNPFRWRTRRELLNQFRHHMAQSPNVVLHVGEIAYGDRPFEATDAGNPHDYQFRTKSELWHKENLLNAIIARWPSGWKYGAIIDGDFHFTRHDWALEAIHLLQHHAWVQLFSSYADMSADHRPFNVRPSFAYCYLNYDDQGNPTHTGYGTQARPTRKRNTTPGATGGAWSFTHEGFNAVGGLLDSCILGAGDWYMAFGLIGRTTDGHPEAISCGKAYEDSIRRWQANAYDAIEGNIGYVDCFATHAFHGTKVRRGYGDRWKILRDNAYDPAVDIVRDWQGIYRLTGNKPKLRDEIRRYFRSRTEDDPNLYGPEKPLV